MERTAPLLFLVLLLPCCSSHQSGRFSMQPEDMRFFEYVSESPGSFREYLVTQKLPQSSARQEAQWRTQP
ncbi:MAG: hypothetical protein WAX07_01065 [Candidatus Altiarchaeia archaeon]